MAAKTKSKAQTKAKAQSKPPLRLVGQDGNAFAILGKACQAARRAGWTEEQVKEFLTEARSDYYDHLLRTCMKYFDVS